MKPAEKFNELVAKKVAPVLKKQGYSKRGTTFRATRVETFALVNFQKSTKSTTDTVIFTVNIGVASRRLLRFFKGTEDANLVVDDCHWQERLGFLMPEGNDKWWAIETETPMTPLELEICDNLERLALPEIEKYAHDEALRDLWLSRSSPGLTNFQRLLNLSVLVKALAPASITEAIVNELLDEAETGPTASYVKAHLRRLEQEVF